MQEENIFELFFRQNEANKWPASKEKMVGVGGAKREKKRRKGENAKDEIQCANNYFLKKVLI